MQNSKMPFDYEENVMGISVSFDQNDTVSKGVDYRLRALENHISFNTQSVLDFGCGAGTIIETIKNRFPNVKARGCDISKRAIELAKKNEHQAVDYRVIDDGSIPFEDQSMDVAICLDVLEHIPDMGKPLVEIRRVLKSEGIFHLHIPCEGNPFTTTWFFSKIKLGTKLTYKNWGHVQPDLTFKKMDKLLTDHGFDIVKKSYSLHFPTQILTLFLYFWPKELLQLLVKGDKVRDYTDAKIHSKINSKKFDPLFSIRKFWSFLLVLNSSYRLLEMNLFKNIPFTALGIHVTCKKKP